MKLNLHNIILSLIMFSPFSYVLGEEYAYGNSHFEACMKKVMDAHPGIVIKVEMKIEDNNPVYEFDIRDEDNQDWDIECHADTAEIIEIEQETFGPQHRIFIENMNVSFKEAKTIVLEQYPGEIIEIEYEIEEGGLAVYEFDIYTNDGKKMKVEIDGATGNIHEEAEEIWQIGYE